MRNVGAIHPHLPTQINPQEHNTAESYGTCSNQPAYATLGVKPSKGKDKTGLLSLSPKCTWGVPLLLLLLPTGNQEECAKGDGYRIGKVRDQHTIQHQIGSRPCFPVTT